MAISSINFRPVSVTSESHNTRSVKLDYNFPELESNNEHSVLQSVQDRLKKIQKFCKEKSGRKLQKNAEPIREAVLNLNQHHTMDDLKDLARELKKEFGISAFQIHIHRDEGRTRDEINYHAHMLFDWQDMEKGTMIRLGKADMSRMQTFVAKHLQMQRGELKTNSNRERLEPIEYKRQQEEIRLQQLQQQTAELEQKKNRVRERIKAIREHGDTSAGKSAEELTNLLRSEKNGVISWSIQEETINQLTDDELKRAISIVSQQIELISNHESSN